MKSSRKIDYSGKLADPRWQKRRLEVFERDCWRCTWCGQGREVLQAHHGNHERDRIDPWECDIGTLYSLWDSCHERAEQAKASVYRKLGNIHPKHYLDVWQLLGQVEELLEKDEFGLEGARATMKPAGTFAKTD